MTVLSSGVTAFETQRRDLFKKCFRCNCSRTLSVRVIQKYVQLLGVPILPLEKVSALYCEACHEFRWGSEIPDSYLGDAFRLSHSARTPIWMYAGVMASSLLHLLMAGLLIQNLR